MKADDYQAPLASLHYIYIFFAPKRKEKFTMELFKSTDGDFIVDKSDPEKDIYRLELNKDFDIIAKKKKIVLKVVHKNLCEE